MYVDQNKTCLILLILIVTNFCFATGEPSTTQNTKIPYVYTSGSINVVGLFKNKVVIVDQSKSHKILRVGDTTSSGLKLIAANSKVATFKDNNGNLMFIGISNDSIASTYTTKKNRIESIKLNEHNQYITKVSINGITPVPAIIDTGANFVILNKTVADQLGLYYKNIAEKVEVATANDKTTGYKLILKHVEIGSINLANIEAIVMDDDDSPEIILIGMSFLKKVDIQYLGDHLELKSRTTSAANIATTNDNLTTNAEQTTKTK